MYFHFMILAGSALGVALGFFYRVASVLMFLAFTQVFLSERALYNNHYYLIALLSFLICFMPLHRAFSLDVMRHPELKSDTCAAWVLWILRLQIAIPYFYGGLAKLNYDWLVRHEPMQTWMRQRTDFPILGQYFTESWCITLFCWSGLLIDLLCVPLLFWRRTRIPMLLIVSLFHIFNARLFDIGIFPWLMLAATWVLFLPPGFIGHLRFWGRGNPENSGETTSADPLPRFGKAMLVTFMVVQLIIPFRHFLYPGHVAITREGHCFSWRMKLNIRDFQYNLRIHYEDGREEDVYLVDWLMQAQARRMRNLDQVVKLARFIRQEREKSTTQRVEVRGTGTVALNKKPPVKIFEDVDLSRQRITLRPARWLLTHPDNPNHGEFAASE